jgi:hypothetical protein
MVTVVERARVGLPLGRQMVESPTSADLKLRRVPIRRRESKALRDRIKDGYELLLGGCGEAAVVLELLVLRIAKVVTR